MPLYDFECRECGRFFEALAAMDADDGRCACGAAARRLVSVGSAYRDDADWLESVTAVVEKGSDKSHVRAFLADPSRTNYRRWMRGEGLRPMEAGEPRPSPAKAGEVHREIWERFKARRGLA
ncbi:MAG: zinc ribbon domain-containing protein [Solidesulfovibrio sp.]